MKYLALAIIFPIICFAETMTVALFQNHSDYLVYSKSYKVNWELLKLAAQKENIHIVSETYVWVRALDQIKKQKIDAVIGAYYTVERGEYGYFSGPMSLDNVYLYSFESKPLLLSNIDKQSAIVGVLTGSLGESIAEQQGFNAVYRKASSEEIFRLLANKRLDFGIFSESIANKHCMLDLQIDKTGGCLKPVYPPLKTGALYTIYSNTPKHVRLANRIDNAIEGFIADESAKKLFLDNGYNVLEYEQWLDLRTHWHNSFVKKTETNARSQ